MLGETGVSLPDRRGGLEGEILGCKFFEDEVSVEQEGNGTLGRLVEAKGNDVRCCQFMCKRQKNPIFS